MDFKELSTKLSALTDDKIDLSTKLNASTAKVEQLETQIADLKTQLTALTTERDELKTASEAEAEPTEAETKLKAQVAKQYTALKALDGEADAQVPDDVDEMLAFVEGHTRLSALIPVDGASTGATTDDGEAAKLAAEQDKRMRAQVDAFRSTK